MFNKKIIICATIKNEEKNLSNFFSIIDRLKHLFKEYYIILIESDSIDQTYSLGKIQLKNLNGKIIKVSTKQFTQRTEKISHCRNQYLSIIKKDINLKKFDYMIVMDVDNINNKLNPTNLVNSIKKAPKNWIGIFPSQIFSYYDLWPLRIKGYLEHDCFASMISDLKTMTAKKSYIKNVFNYYFIINKFKHRFIKVKSAFGGMGIYKIKYILRGKYSTNKGKFSEHVNFHKSISHENKSFYIDKKLINSYGLNEHFLKAIFYTVSGYYLNKLIKQFTKINKNNEKN